jgi:HAD superfamily hydrolase (TIGR01509 family)
MLNDGFKAIIFDMDGVITDTEALHRQAEELTCRHYELDAPRSEWQNFQGRTAENIFGYLIGKYGGGRNIPVSEIVEFKTRAYLELTTQELPIIPGVLEFIKLARRNLDGVALATGSNRAVQRAVFDRYDLARYFDAVVTGDEVRMAKPDPEAYLKASTKLGQNPAECLVIEDSDNGVRAGVGAGCQVIGITTSFPRQTLNELGAHLVVDTYEELARLLGWH